MARRSVWAAVGVLLVVAIGLGIWLGLYPPWSKGAHGVAIGALLPLTGSGATYGQNAQRGIDLALGSLRAAGGTQAQTLRVIYEDSQMNPQVGISGAHKLIDVDGVPAIIGEMASTVTLAVAPVCEKSRVVLMSPASSNPQLTNAGDYIFRDCLSDVYEGGVMATMAKQKLGFQRVAILYINNDYGVGLRDVFSTEFKRLGGAIVDVEAFEQDATDFRTQLSKIAAQRPDAVFLLGYKEMIQVLVQSVELGLHFQFLSTVMFDDPEILKQAGSAAEGVVFTTWAYEPAGGYAPASTFKAQYLAKYGSEPGIFSAEAYDAMILIGNAIEDGAGTGSQIRDALYRVSGYQGASGIITIDKNGDTTKPLMLKVVRNGQFQFLQ